MLDRQTGATGAASTVRTSTYRNSFATTSDVDHCIEDRDAAEDIAPGVKN